MSECPSRLKQQDATCLIQSRCNLPVTCYCIGENKQLVPPSLTQVPELPPSTHPIITLHTILHKVMGVTGRFITLHDSRRRKCHLGTLLLRLFTFSISQGKCCACKSWARWTEFHFGEGKLLSAAANHPLHGVYGAIVPHPIYHRGWPAHLHHEDLTRDKRTFGHEHVYQCACACVCVVKWSRRGVGESNLSHRGAETGGQICSRPRITPAVSMNEMTGLQGY